MFEENKDFYPTPDDVIKKMLDPYMDCKGYGIKKGIYTILEPSAGKGDIVKYINNLDGIYRGPDVYTFENDINLQPILKKQKQIFLGDDFLEYKDETSFDLIVMNPPFSNGVDHLLKAWEVAQNTEIVCLLNSETINNPFSKKRKLLLNIIENNKGSIEDLGTCFDTAERKTGVNVSMVRLTKKTDLFDFDFNFDKEQEELIEDDFVEKGVMSFNKIESIVSEYNEAKENMKEVLKSVSKLQSVSNRVTTNMTGITELLNDRGTNKETYNNFIASMKRGVWRDLIDKSKIEKFMTTKLRKTFESYVNEQQNIEISENNIKKFIEFVMINKGTILENGIEELFDDLTKYSEDNKFFPEGRKTNDNWKVNKKIIIDRFGLGYDNGKRWGIRPNFSFYGNSDKLSNIDKIMCYLTGKDFNKIYSLNDCVRKMADGIITGTWYQSEFFEVKIYKKGSAHLKFLDESLWQEFNMRACAMKNWLPKGEAEQWEKEKQEKKEQENILKLT